MKNWIVGVVIAVLGLGGYASVELAPLSPKQRKEKISQLPIVKGIVDARNIKVIEAAMEEVGYLSITVGSGERTVWQDAEELYRQSQEGNIRAKSMVRAILSTKGRKRMNDHDIDAPAFSQVVKEAMSQGNVMGYVSWYMKGDAIGDEKMVKEAIEFFRTSETATASWWLYAIENKEEMCADRNPIRRERRDLAYAVLAYQMAREDLPELGTNEETLARWSLDRKQYIKKLYDAAESGDEWSQKIVAELEKFQGGHS